MKTIKKEPLRFEKIARKLSPLVAITVLVLLSFSLFDGISRMKEVASRIDRERDKVDKLKTQGDELREDLEIAMSEEFIEKQLRDNLGLAKDGEIVVILPDKEAVKYFAPRLDEDEEIVLKPNWKKWFEVFF